MADVLPRLAPGLRADAVNPASQIVVGLAISALGLSYRLPAVALFDQKLFTALHTLFQRPPWIKIFRAFWPIGRSEFLIVVVIGLAIYKLPLGISAGLAFLIWGLIDRLIKRDVNRARPFNHLPDVHMLQPKKPKDPSFPSGDTFHIWFLLSIILQTITIPWPIILVLVLIAVLVSLGRIAMGVHFPTDIFAGAGIGLAAAGCAICINSYIIFILNEGVEKLIIS